MCVGVSGGQGMYRHICFLLIDSSVCLCLSVPIVNGPAEPEKHVLCDLKAVRVKCDSVY